MTEREEQILDACDRVREKISRVSTSLPHQLGDNVAALEEAMRNMDRVLKTL